MTQNQKNSSCPRACPTLPAWEELPDLELYMDQVLSLVSRYLAAGDEKVLTASMVNNYVKQKLLPPPVNKRYNRSHIASLLMLCILKSVLPIAAVQQLFQSCGVEDMPTLYGEFRTLHSQINRAVSGQVARLLTTRRQRFLSAALGSQASQALAMELLPTLNSDE